MLKVRKLTFCRLGVGISYDKIRRCITQLIYEVYSDSANIANRPRDNSLGFRTSCKYNTIQYNTLGNVLDALASWHSS